MVEGGTLLEGRVEICYNSRWGTVCDGVWDNNDATVVCRQIAAEYGLEFADELSKLCLCVSTSLILEVIPMPVKQVTYIYTSIPFSRISYSEQPEIMIKLDTLCCPNDT